MRHRPTRTAWAIGASALVLAMAAPAWAAPLELWTITPTTLTANEDQASSTTFTVTNLSTAMPPAATVIGCVRLNVPNRSASTPPRSCRRPTEPGRRPWWVAASTCEPRTWVPASTSARRCGSRSRSHRAIPARSCSRPAPSRRPRASHPNSVGRTTSPPPCCPRSPHACPDAGRRPRRRRPPPSRSQLPRRGRRRSRLSGQPARARPPRPRWLRHRPPLLHRLRRPPHQARQHPGRVPVGCLSARDPAGTRRRPAIDIGAGTGLDGIEWTVPAVALGSPGIAVMVWVALQTASGVVWLPWVRRLRRSRREAA